MATEPATRSPATQPIELNFHDPVAQRLYDEARHACSTDSPGAIAATANEDRFAADPRTRLRAAVRYAAVGVHHAHAGALAGACQYLHYSGQVFRGLGMNAKAAMVYAHSGRTGLRWAQQDAAAVEPAQDSLALRTLTLRSFGRAVLEFDASGQATKAIRARVELHDAELQLGRLEPLRRLGHHVWRSATLYSTSWPRTVISCVITIAIAAHVSPVPGLALQLVATALVVATIIHRSKP